MSSEIDDYFVTRDEGIRRAKPRLRLSKWWADLCSNLEQRGFQQWTEANNILLSFSPEEQDRAEQMFRQLTKNVRKNWRDPKHRCSVVMSPHPHKSDAVALFAFRDQQRDSRHQRMENIASRVFTKPHVKRCLVLALNIDKKSYPYGTLMIFFRGETPTEAKSAELVVY